MRILLVTSEYGSYVCGGLGSHVNQLVEYLVSMGIQLTVGLANHECVAVIAYDGLQERCLSLKQPSVLNGDWHDDQMAANQLLANEIMRLYPELPFDLIHTHDWISFPVGRQLVHHGRQPHISTVHVFQAMLERTGYIPDQRACAIEAAMCAESDHVITVSNYMHEQVVVQPGVRPHAVTRIYNWLDPDQFNRESAEAVQHLRQQLAPAGEQIVLFVGRLSIQKGVEFLLESAEYVLAERPHTRWVVVGRMKPNAEKRLHKFMQHAGGAGHISFIPEQPRICLERYYRAADCLVMPSVYEPFGFVAVEAMAAGTPVIVSDVDGLREIVDHQQNGLRVPVEPHSTPAGPNIKALVEAQLRLLSDEQLRLRFSAAGQAKVRTEFSAEQVLPQLITVYEQQIIARQSK